MRNSELRIAFKMARTVPIITGLLASILLLAASNAYASPGLFVTDIGEGYIVGLDPVDFYVAENLCDFAGKTLVSIESVEEDKLIHFLLRNASINSPLWTSGTNSGSGSYMLWKWGNREPFYYSRWLVSYPLHDTTYCLVLDGETLSRSWVTADCSDTYLPLCENKPIVATTAAPSTPVT